MYRDASFSFEEKIARLEAEISELRALGGKRRERRLVVAMVTSMIIAIHAAIGCVTTKVQADRLQRDAWKRLEGRTTALVTCAYALDARTKEVDASRARMDGCACSTPAVFAQPAVEWDAR
jgi:hypothetical protein